MVTNIKRFIPRSLYGRFLLIIVLPVLIVQLVSVYVFYYTHLDVVSKYMARSVASEMSFVKKSINKPNRDELLDSFQKDIDIKFTFDDRFLRKQSKIGDSDWRRHKIYNYINLFPIIDPYHRFKSELNGHNLVPFEIYENPYHERFIIVKVETDDGNIFYDIPTKRITSSSAKLFTIWLFITALVTSVISIIFLRNQIKSITYLRDAADKFGRGQDVPDFKPSGSKEIRSVAISFIKMKERIIRQINQRTDMLSSVSHDLRTPLTRIKLQLELMPQSPEIEDLKADIVDMEKLVEEYLDFARSDDKEKDAPVKIKEYIKNRIVDFYAKMDKEIACDFKIQNSLKVSIKKLALKRALINLIDNAFHYGDHVKLELRESKNNLIITIDDDGPGIDEAEYQNVFKPFYRIDDSRNLDKKLSSGGSGLGLAIAMDAITSQGGRIRLSKGVLGGLRVSIYIPI